ncbi:hypothetical protein [Mesorhizobium sp. M0579]|uniref:hypothetical protein n=1 Tax=Mesorhizobium sp. M0579 TaxID=2956962 RepID=UPI00333CC064
MSAVLFCPARHAINVARVDYGWHPAPGSTSARPAWLTATGERVDHVARLDGLSYREKPLRIFLGFGCAADDIAEIRFEARTGRFIIVGG